MNSIPLNTQGMGNPSLDTEKGSGDVFPKKLKMYILKSLKKKKKI